MLWRIATRMTMEERLSLRHERLPVYDTTFTAAEPGRQFCNDWQNQFCNDNAKFRAIKPPLLGAWGSGGQFEEFCSYSRADVSLWYAMLLSLLPLPLSLVANSQLQKHRVSCVVANLILSLQYCLPFWLMHQSCHWKVQVCGCEHNWLCLA